MCRVDSQHGPRTDPILGAALSAASATSIHLLAGTLVLATSLAAQPWPEGIQIFTASSVEDSSSWKQVTVNCPSGTIAYHGGASVTASSELPVVIEQSLPVGGVPPTQWLALAQEVEPTSELWRVSAFVHCADVPGYELVNVQSDLNSDVSRELTASCPPGKSVVGGGGGVFFFDQDLGLVGSMADEGGWTVSAREIRPTNASWLLSAFASCAPISELYEIGVLTRADDPDEGLTLFCGFGDRLVAGGASLRLDGAGAALQTLDPGPEHFAVKAVDVLSPYSALLLVSNLCWRATLFADGFESGDTTFW